MLYAVLSCSKAKQLPPQAIGHASRPQYAAQTSLKPQLMQAGCRLAVTAWLLPTLGLKSYSMWVECFFIRASTSGGGVPMIAWIFSIWSISLVPGNRGNKLTTCTSGMVAWGLVRPVQ